MADKVQSVSVQEISYLNKINKADRNSVFSSNRADTPSSSSVELEKKVRTEQDINQDVKKIVSNYSNITEQYVYEQLEKLGYDISRLLGLDVETYEKVKTSLNQAILSASRSGEVNLSLFEKRLRGYHYHIVKNGDSIENAAQKIKEFENLSLMDILKKKNTSLQNKSFEEIKASGELKTEITKFINTSFSKSKEKLEGKSEQEQQKIIQRQMSRFYQLLANCTPEEKAEITNIVIEIIDPAAYVKAIDTVKGTIETTKELKAFLDNFSLDDKALLGISNEDMARIETILAGKADDEALDYLSMRVKNFIPDFKARNADVLKSIEEKQRLAKETGIEPEYTEKEQEVIELKKKIPELLSAVVAGNLSALAANKNATEAAKAKHADVLNQYKDEQGISNESVVKIMQILKNQYKDEIFGGMSDDEIIANFNKYTDNSYSSVTGEVSALTINDAHENKQVETPEQSVSIGFSNSATCPILSGISEEVALTEEKDCIIEVESVDATKLSKMASQGIVSNPVRFFSYITSNGYSKGMKLLGENFNDASSLLKTIYLSYLKQNKDNLYTILISASSQAHIAAIEDGLVDEELGKKLGLTSDKMILIANIQDKINTKKS